MNESKSILHKNSFYEEWLCLVPGCAHSSTYVGVSHLHKDLLDDRMEWHGSEIHKTQLVRVFLNKADMQTSMEVENLPHLHLKEIDSQLSDLQEYAKKLADDAEYRLRMKEVHGD